MPELTIYMYLTLCKLQSRLQHIYHRQTYARVDLNPMPESTLSPSQGLWIRSQLTHLIKKLVCDSQHLLVDLSITNILLVKNLLTESNYRSGIDPSLKNRTRFGHMSYEQIL